MDPSLSAEHIATAIQENVSSRVDAVITSSHGRDCVMDMNMLEEVSRYDHCSFLNYNKNRMENKRRAILSTPFLNNHHRYGNSNQVKRELNKDFPNQRDFTPYGKYFSEISASYRYPQPYGENANNGPSQYDRIQPNESTFCQSNFNQLQSSSIFIPNKSGISEYSQNEEARPPSAISSSSAASPSLSSESTNSPMYDANHSPSQLSNDSGFSGDFSRPLSIHINPSANDRYASYASHSRLLQPVHNVPSVSNSNSGYHGDYTYGETPQVVTNHGGHQNGITDYNCGTPIAPHFSSHYISSRHHNSDEQVSYTNSAEKHVNESSYQPKSFIGGATENGEKQIPYNVAHQNLQYGQTTVHRKESEFYDNCDRDQSFDNICDLSTSSIMSLPHGEELSHIVDQVLNSIDAQISPPLDSSAKKRIELDHIMRTEGCNLDAMSENISTLYTTAVEVINKERKDESKLLLLPDNQVANNSTGGHASVLITHPFQRQSSENVQSSKTFPTKPSSQLNIPGSQSSSPKKFDNSQVKQKTIGVVEPRVVLKIQRSKLISKSLLDPNSLINPQSPCNSMSMENRIRRHRDRTFDQENDDDSPNKKSREMIKCRKRRKLKNRERRKTDKNQSDNFVSNSFEEKSDTESETMRSEKIVNTLDMWIKGNDSHCNLVSEILPYHFQKALKDIHHKHKQPCDQPHITNRAKEVVENDKQSVAFAKYNDDEKCCMFSDLLPPYSSIKSNKLIQSNKKNSSVKGCHKKGHKKKRKRKLREYEKLVDERSTRSQLSTMDIDIEQNKIATKEDDLRHKYINLSSPFHRENSIKYTGTSNDEPKKEYEDSLTKTINYPIDDNDKIGDCNKEEKSIENIRQQSTSDEGKSIEKLIYEDTPRQDKSVHTTEKKENGKTIQNVGKGNKTPDKTCDSTQKFEYDTSKTTISCHKTKESNFVEASEYVNRVQFTSSRKNDSSISVELTKPNKNSPSVYKNIKYNCDDSDEDFDNTDLIESNEDCKRDDDIMKKQRNNNIVLSSLTENKGSLTSEKISNEKISEKDSKSSRPNANITFETETNGEWMFCDVKGCSFWTRKKVRMARHKMSHVPGDNRFYQCPDCGIRMCSLPKLLRHDRKLHTGFKDYECKICEAEVTDINVHMRVSFKFDYHPTCYFI